MDLVEIHLVSSLQKFKKYTYEFNPVCSHETSQEFY